MEIICTTKEEQTHVQTTATKTIFALLIVQVKVNRNSRLSAYLKNKQGAVFCLKDVNLMTLRLKLVFKNEKNHRLAIGGFLEMIFFLGVTENANRLSLFVLYHKIRMPFMTG